MEATVKSCPNKNASMTSQRVLVFRDSLQLQIKRVTVFFLYINTWS